LASFFNDDDYDDLRKRYLQPIVEKDAELGGGMILRNKQMSAVVIDRRRRRGRLQLEKATVSEKVTEKSIRGWGHQFSVESLSLFSSCSSGLQM
jgi:hypothetical protein